MTREPSPDGMSNSSRAVQIKSMKPRHQEVARRLVLGQTQAQICRALNMNQGWMSLLSQMPLFKAYMAKLNDQRERGVIDITQQIAEASPHAIEILERTMYTTEDDKLRIKCAQDILDRGGYSAVSKSLIQVHRTETSNLSPDEKRELIKKRLQKAKDEADAQKKLIMDAEAIEIEFEDVEPLNEPVKPSEKKRYAHEEGDPEFGGI